MASPSSALQELAEAAGRLGGQATGILKDRLELLALELREQKILGVQALILAFAGSALVLLGLVLLAAAAILALPPEWRAAALALGAVAALVAGGLVLNALRRRLGAGSGAFTQSIAELKKDTECF